MLKETPKIKWDWNCLDVVAKFFSLSNTIDLNSLKLDIIHTSEEKLLLVKTPCKVSKDGWFVVLIPADSDAYDYEAVVGIDPNAPLFRQILTRRFPSMSDQSPVNVEWNFLELKYVAEFLLVANRNEFKNKESLISYIKSVALRALYNNPDVRDIGGGGWVVNFVYIRQNPSDFYDYRAFVTINPYTAKEYAKKVLGCNYDLVVA